MPESATLTDADRVALWLASPEGTAALRWSLEKLRLPVAFDTDLVGMVIHAADRMVQRGDVIESVPAWTRRTLRLRAIDLMKSPRGRPAFIQPEDVDSPAGAGTDAADAAELVAAMDLAEIRREIAGRWDDRSGWTRSASLTYLSVAIDGCAPGVSCPAPIGGADEFDAAHWAGLHYADQRQCFAPFGERDDNTIRQRRKRRIDDVRKILVDAYVRTQADGSGAGDHG
ncbi:MAG: hypothetical protein ABIR32_16150 [Ilumatobacteraceae bacterium]